MRTKTVLFTAAIILSFILTACGGNKTDQGKTPSGMNIQRGRNYKEVIEDFEDRGFTNIRTEPIEDLVFGWVVKNGEVEEISVGGDTNYDAGVWIPLDTEIVIRYHTFKTGEDVEPENAEGAQEDQAENADEAVTKIFIETSTEESMDASMETSKEASTETSKDASTDASMESDQATAP